jgi:acyl-CoA synthetase (NDP forming)
MQSGGLGFAMVDQLTRLGIGISSFASVGNKLDVSSNDMLMWWEQDGVTKVAVMYIESFGNPRKFARTARRVGARMPVLTVHAGRSAAGQQAAASHTAAIATPLVTREALFEQAGIIATPTFGELVEATALLATQPVPAGRNVAIVSNVGGAGVLAADACTDLGLTVHHPRGQNRRRLHALIPEGGTVNGPVDTTATVSREDFTQVLELLAADEDVSALIALVLPTAATGDLVAAVAEAGIRVPLAVVVLNQPEAVRLLERKPAPAPCYGYPEAAVRALARAVRYGEWRARPHGETPRFPDIEGYGGMPSRTRTSPVDEARALVRAFLTRTPGGGWLPAAERHALLRGYGIPVAPITTVHAEDDAVAAFRALTGASPGFLTGAAADGLSGATEERGSAAREEAAPKAPVPGGSGGRSMASPRASTVVLKADVPGLVHKSEAGAVLLDLRTEQDVRAGYRQLAGSFGGRLSAVGVQPMITGGTEVMIGVADDQMFGPLVLFGLGGVATEVLADHSARLAPLTSGDADALIDSLRAAPLLRGHHGTPAADVAALRDVLMRVSRLADDIPEICELDLNPVIARPDGAVAVDARIKVVPQPPRDPFLRRLRLLKVRSDY